MDYSGVAIIGALIGGLFSTMVLMKKFTNEISTKQKFLIDNEVYQCKKLETKE